MKGKLARRVVWVSSARVLINLIGLASTLLLARFLMPADFGLVAIAMTFVTIIGSITEISIGAALVQHENPTDEHYDTAFTLSAARSVLLGLSVAALAWPIAALYGDPRLFPVLLVIAASMSITGFNNPRMAIFTRRLEFWQSFAFGVSGKLLGFIVAVAIAYYTRSYWALVISTVAVQIQGLALSYVFLPKRPRFSQSKWRELMGFSVWLSLGQMVNTLNNRSDTLFVGYFLGTQQVGYYTFGDNLAALPTREATAPIAQTLFPAFSRLNGDPPRLRSAYQRAQALLCAVALPVGFGFAILAEPLVLATVGAKWLPAVIVIQVLSGLFAAQTLASSVFPLAMAMGETRLLFRRNVVDVAIRLPLIIVGLATGGLVGVVYARLCSGAIGILIDMAMARHLLDLPIAKQLQVNLRSLGAVAVMCATLLLGPSLVPGLATIAPLAEMAVLIVSGGVTYLATLLGLWLVAGRPDGPEAELLGLANRTRTMLSRTRSESVG